ncbi:hypothetical protein [Nitratiruptor sp. SB155-2]|uniref:hypothetical protein n=1 Tax=Nitratiruptor sp. (strain SB155-2) TaxID=387092 RepID=UPI0001587410|nr:hypothetical protein [Nitratiruptor sp. SB155-2]BAF70790.1 hypothetical protein NIS_1684 [Nitratiruptor sp. SB155-2]
MTNLVIVNTKGGVGKTNVGLNVLPTILRDRKITYYQLDNNNKLVVDSQNINIREFRLNELDQALTEIEFSDDDVNIIDAGGGDDVKAVLNEVANSILNNVKFIIPINQNLSLRHNIKDTVKLIKEKFSNPKIFLFFNFINKNTELDQDYINIFGNETFDIKPLPIINQLEKAFGFAPNNNIFQILEINKKILLDKYLEVKGLVENKEKLLTDTKNKLHESIKEGKIDKDIAQNEYYQLRKNINQAKEIVDLVNDLKAANEKFLKAVTE